jgi:7-cyano-7-deazaguanine synthase in queuosine biosynthesis
MLTNPEMKLPNSTYAELPEGISPTYVPFRNGQLLSRIAGIAQGWIMEQDTLGLTATASIWFGAHADDAARDAYPDCTPEFIGNMASAIYLGTYRRVRLITPFTHMEKKSIVDIGASLALPYMLTWSCYDGGPKHCGVCPTCRARKEAFTLAHVPDPTQYENTSIVKSGLSGTYSPPNPNMIDLKGGVLLSPPPMEEPPPPMAEPSAPFMAEPSAPFMEEPKAFVQRNLPLDLNGDDIPF